MKNRILKTLFMSVLLSFVAVSCSDDDKLPIDFDDLEVTGDPFAQIVSTDGLTNFNLIDPTDSSYSRVFQFDSQNDGADVQSINVYAKFNDATVEEGDPDLTADEILYRTADASSFDNSAALPKSPALEFNALELLGLNGLTIDDISPGDNYTFRVTLTTTDGREVGDVSSNFENQSADHASTSTFVCPSDIGGMYSVTTTYGYHDFLPDFNPYTTEVEIEDLGGGSYFIEDFSGGLYTVGPYAGAYGTDETSIAVTFDDVCGMINWADQTDPWGDVIPAAGGVNEIDQDTGVITISWFCTGYGESGVSIYTPL